MNVGIYEEKINVKKTILQIDLANYDLITDKIMNRMSGSTTTSELKFRLNNSFAYEILLFNRLLE